MARLSMILLVLTYVAVMAWTLAAILFQTHGDVSRWALICGEAMVAAFIVMAIRKNLCLGWCMLLATIAAIAVIWSTVLPQEDLEWAPDVMRNVTAQIDGNKAVIHNIRAFDWLTEDEAVPHWKDGVYPLDGIVAVDLFTSVWGSPAIAHILVSFGFLDGRHLVFSAETRREANEPYSSVGGFFKAFELVLIAAEENDIIKLRTNSRGEDVSMFPLKLGPEQARALFISYLERGNGLSQTPEFYNTISANCTTVVFRLARLLDPGLPIDWRILASGYLPSYLHDLGALKTDMSLEAVLSAARITSHARAVPGGVEYSAWIRTRQVNPAAERRTRNPGSE
ncbi:Lnb N-terminal periplasmic domain-containing protein [Falsirhodobacter sp. 1013]|uniref:Lnb N-terminal periplasmic domain-containing protein n=1 Tax=Falsirhodobacter sp. 1013 TaxID=3417566 RepID=UPI003EB9B969